MGKEIVIEMMSKEGYDLSQNFTDCGVEIFDRNKQDTHAGGSGCGCSASVLNGYILKEMKKKSINKVLFMATGALHSTLITQQGESIPSIAHAIVIDNKKD